MLHRCLRFTALCAFAAFASAAGLQTATPWKDLSPHRVSMVTVAPGIQLEVLDWGGSGRPVMLLASLGHTAHIYDDLAPKLAASNHVYGITRRGYGASTRPGFGYDAISLSNDVLAVLDALKLKPVLVGHSIAGEELNVIGARHPGSTIGLVYLNAATDRTAKLDPKVLEVSRKLSTLMPHEPPPTAADRGSIATMQDYLRKVSGVTFPEGEVAAQYSVTTTGVIGRPQPPQWVDDAVKAGIQKPDYAGIAEPALAIYAIPRSAHDLVPAWVIHESSALSEALEQEYELFLPVSKERTSAFQQGVKNSKVVELPGANHFLFLSNEADTLRELRTFIGSLK